MKGTTISKKNYYIFAVISILTFVLVFYLTMWYNTSKEYYKNNSVMNNFLSSIMSNEIHNYLLDNPNVIIYMAASNDESIKNFENQFKKLILKEEIKNEIIYLDTSKIKETNFYEDLNKNYLDSTLQKKGFDVSIIPNLIIIHEGKITAILYKEKKKITKEDVEHFLKIHEVINNND